MPIEYLKDAQILKWDTTTRMVSTTSNSNSFQGGLAKENPMRNHLQQMYEIDQVR